MILEILLWISVFALFHSYILFPFILRILARNKKENGRVYNLNSSLPFVSIIMAVHNEEQVLVEKINSLFYTNYPINRFEVLVGSDASNDGTNRILGIFTENYDRCYFKAFQNRTGKPQIINKLVTYAKGDILLITDANVFLNESTIFETVRHFQNPKIGLVDTRIIHRGNISKGIAFQENAYLNREFSIKDMESKLWGTMMGPFGGCYAIKRELFRPVPENFIADDFFLNMSVLSSGFIAITSPGAIVTEDVPSDIFREFKRKIRIAAGNFQNLNRFFYLLWPPWKPLGFCFLSHKIFRWLGPFFILFAMIAIIILREKIPYSYLLILQILILSVPLLDFFLRILNLNVVVLRFITHFLLMNLAMLAGFVKFITGIRTNIWQPTMRNQ